MLHTYNYRARVLSILMAIMLVCGLIAPAMQGAGTIADVLTGVTALADPTTGTSGGSSDDDAAANEFFANFVDSNGHYVKGDKDAKDGDMQGVVQTYKKIAMVITSLLTVTMLILMLIQFTKLGAAGDNETARKKAISGILTTGVATALLGGATVVIGFFWNTLTKTVGA